MMTAKLKNTYALIVGIERYQLGKKYDLLGPANDACAFAGWLWKKGVPLENILLFSSPLIENVATFQSGGPLPLSATQERIEKALKKTLPAKENGDLLYIFWEGHGFVFDSSNLDNRRLYFAEANNKERANLDLDSLLKSLRTTFFRSFRHQICIIHSCAIKLDAKYLPYSLEPTKFNFGEEKSPCEQLVLFSSREGSPAWTDSFFNEVMESLEHASKNSWPPKKEEILRVLDTMFSSNIYKESPSERWYRWFNQPSNTSKKATSRNSKALAKPCIFISYCLSSDDEGSKHLREIILTSLKDKGFEIRTSADQQVLSNDWRRRLNHWMQQCHGAIVLFSENSLQSDRFIYEIQLLNWRKSLKREFILHHILSPSMNCIDLQRVYLTHMVNNNLYRTDQERISDIISNIMEQLNSLSTRLATNPIPSSLQSPIQDLEAVLDSWLRKLNRRVLIKAMQTLGLNLAKWPQNVNECRLLLAHELLRNEFAHVIETLRILAPHLDPNVARKVLEILSPSWVDEQAVAPIPEIVRRSLPQWCICVNGTKTFTGEMYIRRACSSFPSWPTLKVNSVFAEDQFGAIIKEIREEYKRIIVDESISNSEIDELLKVPKRSGSPYFVVVPRYLDDEILTRLREMYPAITFFLMSGDDLLDAQELARRCIEFLYPKLNPEQEDNAYNLYFDARVIVNSSHPRY